MDCGMRLLWPEPAQNIFSVPAAIPQKSRPCNHARSIRKCRIFPPTVNVRATAQSATFAAWITINAQPTGLTECSLIARAWRWRVAEYRRQRWLEPPHLVRQRQARYRSARWCCPPRRQQVMRQRTNRENPFRQHRWQPERGLHQQRSGAEWHFRYRQET